MYEFHEDDGPHYEQNYGGYNKVKETINKVEVFPEPTIFDITICIMSAVNITDMNLLALDNRIKSIRRPKEQDRIILQSEANSIFRGNFIRSLKTKFKSCRDLNRVKRRMEFITLLDPVNAIVNGIEAKEYYKHSYQPKWEIFIVDQIKKALDGIEISDYEKEGYAAMEKWKANAIIAPPIIKDIKDIDLNSIKNIKF